MVDSELPEIFACSICKKSFCRKASFKTHMKIHNEHKMFQCSECNKNFTLRYDLQIHLRVHRKEQPYSCKECGSRFTHVSSLHRHLARHAEITNHLCEFCGLRFGTTTALRIHSQIVRQEERKCNACQLIFSSRCEWRNHMNEQISHMPYSCKFCKKRFLYRMSCKCDTKNPKQQFCCMDCGKIFESRSGFSLHRRRHLGLKSRPCEFCRESFSSNKALKIHSRMTNSYEKECVLCKVKFSSKCEWKKHMNEFPKHKPFACLYCGDRFLFPKQYEHHKARNCFLDISPFACLPCRMIFSSRQEMDEHKISTHDITDEKTKPLKCMKCKASLPTELSLREHVCVDRFPCWVCKDIFSTWTEVRAHTRSAHPGMLPWQYQNAFQSKKDHDQYLRPRLSDIPVIQNIAEGGAGSMLNEHGYAQEMKNFAPSLRLKLCFHCQDVFCIDSVTEHECFSSKHVSGKMHSQPDQPFIIWEKGSCQPGL